MKIVGNFIKRVINENNNSEITLEVTHLQNQELVKTLEKGKTYRITLEEVKTKRSIEQNALMWEIIHQIGIKRNGERSNDDWEIYIEALERAGAKYEYIAVLPSAEPLLKQNFRAIKKMNSFIQNGKTFNVYKTYYGSSKMDTKEMSLLLETVKDIAIENEVEDFWSDIR